jgi:phosphohistidine phosphatase
MKTLTVVRHAHAENARPGQEDADRGLSARGQQEAAATATHLATFDPSPDLLLVSPARRARSTAEALTQALAFDPPAVIFDDRLYNASVDTLFEVVRAVPAAPRHVVVVGHNPGLSAFIRALTGTDRELAPAGIWSCEISLDGWQTLAPVER